MKQYAAVKRTDNGEVFMVVYDDSLVPSAIDFVTLQAMDPDDPMRSEDAVAIIQMMTIRGCHECGEVVSGESYSHTDYCDCEYDDLCVHEVCCDCFDDSEDEDDDSYIWVGAVRCESCDAIAFVSLEVPDCDEDPDFPIQCKFCGATACSP